MSRPSTHKGSCHCGAVRYQVELDLAQPALSCNCSICGRSGSLLQFVPPDKFTLEAGADHLTDYQFHHHAIHHLFCRTCGIKSFARGKGPDGEMIAINVRCIEGIDTFTIPTQPYDGRSR